MLYQQASNFGTKTFYYYNKTGKAYEARIYRDGQLIEFVKDRNLDGQWDEWTYYENGRLVRSEYDNNFDGKPDVYYNYSNGEAVSVERDTDFNGIPDDFSTYTNSLLQRTDIKPNGASYTITRVIYKNGVITEILRGGDSNGNFKEDVKYDSFFNPVPIGFNPISTTEN